MSKHRGVTVQTTAEIGQGAGRPILVEEHPMAKRQQSEELPYGYKRDGGRLTEVADELETVRNIYAMRRAGETLRAIAALINKDELAARTRITRWTEETVRRILSDMFYKQYASAASDLQGEEGRVEHHNQYQLGRYRVVEQIEKAGDGFCVSVTAYDDNTAHAFPWSPVGGDYPTVVQWRGEVAVSTLEEARHILPIFVQTMKESIKDDMP